MDDEHKVPDTNMEWISLNFFWQQSGHVSIFYLILKEMKLKELNEES